MAVARISNVSPALTVPLRAASPSRRATGIGSPVSAASSIMALAAGDQPVDRDHLAGAHQDDVADRDLLDRDIGDGLDLPAMRDTGRAVDQGLEVTLRARDREILQHIAARIHDGDHDAGEILAKRERGCHRHEVRWHRPPNGLPASRGR